MSGNPVVNYTYDSWGKQLACTGSLANTLGLANPLRYRGYIYDSETGLYYLQSRYYNPEWGRFYNSDDFDSINNNSILVNKYAYCINDPINLADPFGQDAANPDQLIVKKYWWGIRIWAGYNKAPYVAYAFNMLKNHLSG